MIIYNVLSLIVIEVNLVVYKKFLYIIECRSNFYYSELYSFNMKLFHILIIANICDGSTKIRVNSIYFHFLTCSDFPNNIIMLPELTRWPQIFTDKAKFDKRDIYKLHISNLWFSSGLKIVSEFLEDTTGIL